MYTRVFLAITLVLLVACSLKLRLGLVNNTGSTISVSVGDESISLSTNQIGEFVYPTTAQKRTLSISLGRCVYSYVMPYSMLESYSKFEKFKGIVMVQMESNAQLYLVPPDVTVPISIMTAGALQQEGFPVSPSGKSCMEN